MEDLVDLDLWKSAVQTPIQLQVQRASLALRASAARLDDPIQPYGTPLPVIVLSFAVPYLIAYMVHLKRDTRFLRIGLWPVGVISWVWLTLTIRVGPIWSMRLVLTTLFLTVGAGTRWAFSTSPPIYHPLPRPLPHPWLRNTNAFKAFDLLYNETRHINIAQYSPPLERIPGSYVPLRRTLGHLAFSMIGLFVFDLFSYPCALIAPKTFGSADAIGGDYQAWCLALALEHGVPVFAVKGFWTVALFVMETAGFVFLWDLLAALGIGSGLYIPEEWPTLTDGIIKATSMNDLWGRRWHKINSQFYLLLAKPFSFYRPLHILSIFLLSALYHLTTYYPVHQTINPRPYLIFYLGAGICCLLERGYYKTRGKKVRGPLGAVWTWGMLVLLSREMVAHEYESGWAGAMRDDLARNPENSMVVNLFHALGWGPSAAELRARL